MPNLIGTAPNQVPTNADLGSAAYMDTSSFYSTGLNPTFRNRIINGDMKICQRTLPYTTSGSGLFYGTDRFLYQNAAAGGTATLERGTISHGGRTKYTFKVTVASGATNLSGVKRWEGITQYIEGFNFQDLVGKPISVSFLFRSNVVGKHSVRLGNGDGGYLTSFYYPVANAVQLVSFTTTAMPDMVNFGNSQADNGNYMRVQICYINYGDLIGPETTDWRMGAGYTANGSANWAGTVGNYIEITELQVEEGPVPTEFEYRPYTVEMALCQRYYNQASNMWMSGQSYSSSGVNGLVIPFRFPVEMRANPTITFSGENDGGSMAALFSGGVSTSQVNINLRSTSGSDSNVWFANFTTIASAEL